MSWYRRLISTLKVRNTVVERLSRGRCKAFDGNRIGNAKATLDFTFDESCRSLESLVAVLVVDCTMMLARIVTAFEEKVQQRLQLGEGVAGVKDMMGTL